MLFYGLIFFNFRTLDVLNVSSIYVFMSSIKFYHKGMAV